MTKFVKYTLFKTDIEVRVERFNLNGCKLILAVVDIQDLTLKQLICTNHSFSIL